jgi:transcriptional regulator with XRE-family HTH domain
MFDQVGPKLRAFRKSRKETLDVVAVRIGEIRVFASPHANKLWLAHRETKMPGGAVTLGDLAILASVYGIPSTALLAMLMEGTEPGHAGGKNL